ncbi:MAG: electron transport complex subunit RsxA [Pseudomonadota bacterium]
MEVSIAAIVVSAILTENFVLTKFLGICPFLGVSKKLSTAFGMSMAVLFVMTLASIATALLYLHVLVPNGLEYLKTIVFILVIAALVQFTETVIMRLSPTLYKGLGIYLPLITTNCAVLGVAVLNVQKEYTFGYALISGFASALGFGMALMIFSGIRERLELADIPPSLRGAAIALITAGILSMAFMGFAGIVKL